VIIPCRRNFHCPRSRTQPASGTPQGPSEGSPDLHAGGSTRALGNASWRDASAEPASGSPGSRGSSSMFRPAVARSPATIIATPSLHNPRTGHPAPSGANDRHRSTRPVVPEQRRDHDSGPARSSRSATASFGSASPVRPCVDRGHLWQARWRVLEAVFAAGHGDRAATAGPPVGDQRDPVAGADRGAVAAPAGAVGVLGDRLRPVPHPAGRRHRIGRRFDLMNSTRLRDEQQTHLAARAPGGFGVPFPSR
jgi:hypothetical protein